MKNIFFLFVSFTLFFQNTNAWSKTLKIKSKEEQLIHTYFDSIDYCFYNSSDNEKGIQYSFLALSYAKKINDEHYASIAYGCLSTFYYNKYNFDSTKFYFKKAMESSLLAEDYYLTKTNSYNELLDIYNSINYLLGNLFVDSKEDERYYRKGLNIIHKVENIESKISFYNSLAMRLLNSNCYDSAIIYADKCIDMAQNYYKPSLYLDNELIRAEIYIAQKKYDVAIAHLRMIIQDSRKYKQPFFEYCAIVDIATCFQNKELYGDALREYANAEKMDFAKLDPNQHLFLLKSKAFILKKIDENEERANLLEQYIQISDSIQIEMDVNKTSFIKNALERELLEVINNGNQQKIKQEHNLKYISFILIAIIICITLCYQSIGSEDYIENRFVLKNNFIVALVSYISAWLLSVLSVTEGCVINRQVLFLCFGLLNFFVSTVFSYAYITYIRTQLKANIWSIKKHSLFFILFIISIIIANIFLSIVIKLIQIDWWSLLLFFTLIVVISILLIIIFIYVKNTHALKHHLQQSVLINQQLALVQKTIQNQLPPLPIETGENVLKNTKEDIDSINNDTLQAIKTKDVSVITLIADNNKDVLELSANSIIYIDADHNYCEIYYEDGKNIKRALIRSTLKKIEEQLKQYNTFLVRCHRSYMVNLLKVNKIEGNANGYKLTINGLSEQLPVSRSYVDTILNVLRSIELKK